METLYIKSKIGGYSVHIDKGLRFNLPQFIKEKPTAFFVITDDHVERYYLKDVTQSLEKVAPVFSYTVPSGETSKSFETYKILIDECVRLQLDRSAMIVALGGGVIGDLAGYVAATYLRGIDYIQIPTTLLAHDSSVGGKVGINHEQGKNLIGAFYPPRAVIYDTETFITLPKREWRGGFVEMVKHALLDSEEFLNGLHKCFTSNESFTADNIVPWLAKAIGVKARVVTEDEKEWGLRAILNLGHTLGHAIEKEIGYGELNHGEAVAIGILFALKVSEKVLQVPLPFEMLRTWFSELGLPTEIPESIKRNKLIESMHQDKKRRGNQLVFILLKSVGEPVIQTVLESTIIEVLQSF